MGLKGAANPNWQGGKVWTQHGYVLLRMPDHPDADVRGYIYEHRVVMEATIGRRLLPTEQVHHIDGNTMNNRPDNLELTGSLQDHRVKHRKRGSKLRVPGEVNLQVLCECGCGYAFLKYDKNGRPRRYISGHNIHPKRGQGNGAV